MYSDPSVRTSRIERTVMAQRTVLTSIWTSVLAALVALLSVLGLGRKTAPVVATAAAPAAPAA
ncbi:hypothetical protein SF23_05870, partial [Streptomyces sp. MBRL 10]